MNKAQIKAELRRSACEEIMPAYSCKRQAFLVAVSFKDNDQQQIRSLSKNQCRTFFLLVAEAL